MRKLRRPNRTGDSDETLPKAGQEMVRSKVISSEPPKAKVKTASSCTFKLPDEPSPKSKETSIFSEDTKEMTLKNSETEPEVYTKSTSSSHQVYTKSTKVSGRVTENQISVSFRKPIHRGHYLSLIGDQKRVLDYLIEKSDGSLFVMVQNCELEDKLNMAPSTIKTNITRLERKGFILRIPKQRSGRSFDINARIFTYSN